MGKSYRSKATADALEKRKRTYDVRFSLTEEQRQIHREYKIWLYRVHFIYVPNGRGGFHPQLRDNYLAQQWRARKVGGA